MLLPSTRPPCQRTVILDAALFVDWKSDHLLFFALSLEELLSLFLSHDWESRVWQVAARQFHPTPLTPSERIEFIQTFLTKHQTYFQTCRYQLVRTLESVLTASLYGLEVRNVRWLDPYSLILRILPCHTLSLPHPPSTS